jgi:RNA polymerase sigma-70 factor (ECF subfamily)
VNGDRQLTQRIASGDRQAFVEFVDAYGARVHRLVGRYVANAADGEDLTQEIFLDLYRCCGNFRGESSLATWVYRVAMNHCLKHRGRAHPAIQLDEEPPEQAANPRDDPSQHTLRHELSGQVHRALDALSPLHRDIVILHELHGLSYEECARVLDVPLGTVKSRLSNAFRRLRTALHEYVLGESTPLCTDVPLRADVPGNALGEKS